MHLNAVFYNFVTATECEIVGVWDTRTAFRTTGTLGAVDKLCVILAVLVVLVLLVDIKH